MNWKAGNAWKGRMDARSLQDLFDEMKEKFDPAVFKKTQSASTFLKQAEYDVVGSRMPSPWTEETAVLHMMDTAFHENGLNYTGGSKDRVLKKMLRAYLVARHYFPDMKTCIYFASPKVNPGPAEELKEMFAELRDRYSSVEWQLLINEEFKTKIYEKTLEAIEGHSDGSELFARVYRLITLMGIKHSKPKPPPPPEYSDPSLSLQDIVRNIMKILLEKHPLPQEAIEWMCDKDYAIKEMGLLISNLPLLRRKKDGRLVDKYSRYWKKTYGGFYVCSQWWQAYHTHNANSLIKYLEKLIQEYPENPRNEELTKLQEDLKSFIESIEKDF